MSGRSRGLEKQGEGGRQATDPTIVADADASPRRGSPRLVADAYAARLDDEDVDTPARGRKTSGYKAGERGHPSIVGQAISHSQPSAKPLLAKPTSQAKKISGTLPPVSSPRR